MEKELEEELDEELEEKTSRKGYKKVKRSAIAIAIAAIIAVCGAYTKSAPHNIKGSLLDLVDENKDNTIFDNILDMDETVGVVNINNGEIEQMQVEDAIKLLEDKHYIDESIKKLGIKNGELNELNDIAKINTNEFLNEYGIDTIVDLYKDKSNTKIEKARIAQQLLYIQKENTEWLKENGIPISKSLLTRILAAGAISSYGTFSAVDYKVCEFDLENNDFVREIVIKDPVSGSKDEIVLFPVLAEEYYKAYGILQFLSSKQEFEMDEINNSIKNSLNISKRCINKQLEIDGLFTYTKKIPKPEIQTEE